MPHLHTAFRLPRRYQLNVLTVGALLLTASVGLAQPSAAPIETARSAVTPLHLPTSSFRTRATDSLRAVLRTAVLPDSQRVLTLFSLEQEYYMNDEPTALRVGQLGLAMARWQGFKRGELMMLSALSRVAVNLNDLPQAERWTQELQRRVEQAPPTLRRFRIVALQNLATVAMAQGDEAKAMRALRQAEQQLSLVANRPDSDFPLNVYYGLSELYASRVAAQHSPADTLLRRARYYTRRFLAEARKLQRPDMEANAFTYQGLIHAATRPDSAIGYWQQAVQLHRQLGERTREAEARQQWAELALRLGQFPVALTQARQAAALAQAVQAAGIEVPARDILAQALAALGRSNEAYHQARLARRLHDSVTQLHNQELLQTLQVRYETQQKESRIKALTQQQELQQARARQQQQRVWWLAGSLVAAAVTMALVGRLALRLRRSRAQLAVQNAELVRTRATQDQLYALVAHDLRSPVVAFSGLADLLNYYVQTANYARLEGLGGRIRQATQHLSELLDNLLNWALSQRGELTLTPQSLAVTELLASTAALYDAAASAAGVQVRCHDAPALHVRADADMTRTILRNVVGNAVAVSPTGSAVHLMAELESAGVVRIVVHDAGPGLSPEQVAHLNQASDVPLRVAETGRRGAGLGLRLSRRFAEVQGGTLVLANAAQGGTEVILRLPAAS